MIRFLGTIFSMLAVGALFGVGMIAALVHHFGRDLPGHEELQDYQPKLLSRVYSGEGEVLAEYYRERRIFVPISEVPDLVKHAFISAEDKNFYEHPGVDAVGIAKAVARYVRAQATGADERLAGASTITQQVMKNFLLDNKRDYERKIKEAILAMRIDGTLSKDQILELYLNEIFFGARAYGVAAAAHNYFGKPLESLNPAEVAYLAALPKAPTALHPVRDHDRAKARRDYVLREMKENGYLTEAEMERWQAEPLRTLLNGMESEMEVAADVAPPSYFTDEVRRQLVSELGDEAVYEGGLTIRATVDDELQAIAAKALRRGLLKYDRQQGIWRGPAGRVEEIGEDWTAALAGADVPRDIPGWSPALVLEVGANSATVGVEATGRTAELDLATENKWIGRREIDDRRLGKPRTAADLWTRGDVVLVENVSDDGEDWRLRQVPKIQGAFMAMDPHSGRILAIQGGFSHDESVFNRATQARRQPGSSFKPFVYAAALDAGFTPATVVLDAPIVIEAGGGKEWKPKNSSGNFSGPIPLRTALERSKNTVTVRLAEEIGMDRIAEYAERFGVYENMPHHLAYSLGAGETTLYQMVAAYGMFANGGKRVQPTVVDRVQDRNGNTLFRHDNRYCEGCDTDDPSDLPRLFDTRDQIMDPVTAFQLTSMLQGVVERGTAASTVGGLGFDVAGKTGTTNDNKDAWFVGYTRNMVAGCFMGFDTPTPMGRKAFGGTLCGPVFREFMAEAMKTRAPGSFDPFDRGGEMVLVKIDRYTGERLPDNATGEHVIVETFLAGTEPELYAYNAIASDNVLFRDYQENDLPFSLGEAAPVEQEWIYDQGGGDQRGGSVDGATGAVRPSPPRQPSSVGFGTGGLY